MIIESFRSGRRKEKKRKGWIIEDEQTIRLKNEATERYVQGTEIKFRHRHSDG